MSVTSVANLLDLAETATQRRLIRDLVALPRDAGFAPGRALPSERKLSERLGVSRPTLRAALQSLESAGVVQPLGARRRTFAVLPDACEIDEQMPGEAARLSLLSDTIAIIASDTADPESSSSEGAVSSAAAAEVRLANLHTLTLSPELLGHGKERTLIAQPPRGLIAFRDGINERIDRTLVLRLVKAGIPVVLYGQASDSPDTHTVSSDHRDGAAKLVHALADAGRRRILPVWAFEHRSDADRPWLVEREAGYHAACAERGLDAMSPVRFEVGVLGGCTKAEIDACVRIAAGFLFEWVKGDRAIDAIMTTSDAQAYVVAAACRLLGVDPAGDVLIVGYDNKSPRNPVASMTADTIGGYQPYATIDKDNPAIGRSLARLVMSVSDHNGEAPAQPRHQFIQPRLVIPGKNVS
ncbi:MAG: GntR family transcriptional regulator [Planctomycetota bacterium]